MDISESQFLLDMRGRVLANREAGRPIEEGITDEEQKRFLALLRPARTAATAVKPAGTKAKSGPVTPMSDDDMDSLFKI